MSTVDPLNSNCDLWALMGDSKTGTREVRKELEKVARWGGQELKITATPQGWEIEVYSCYDEGDAPRVKFKIPKLPRAPISIETKNMREPIQITKSCIVE